MKRLLMFVLCALLLVCIACDRVPSDAGETVTTEPDAGDSPEPQSTNEPTAAPVDSGLPKPQFIAKFSTYENLKENEAQATMFYYDLDGDGTEEEIGMAIDWEANNLTITDGSRSIVLEESAMLDTVYLCDLDPASPWRNLIVCADWASDDYVTTVLHPAGDALITDKTVDGWVAWVDGAFCVDERTGLFGTNSGTRAYWGDAFETDSEWLDCYMPTAEDRKENRQELFEGGLLMHLVRDLPCTVNGQPAVITKGNCILLVRFHESFTQAEICTEDGSVHAMVAIDYNQDEWSFIIDGVELDAYFDNLLYAD